MQFSHKPMQQKEFLEMCCNAFFSQTSYCTAHNNLHTSLTPSNLYSWNSIVKSQQTFMFQCTGCHWISLPKKLFRFNPDKFWWPKTRTLPRLRFLFPSVFLKKYYGGGRGPGSSVGIATDYRLDGLGSNPGGDEIFRPPRLALGPIQPPVQWVPGLSRG